MKNRHIVVFTLLLIAAYAHANVGMYFPGNGGVVYPGVSRDFTMTGEQIEIDVYHGYDYPFFKAYEWSYERDFYYIEYNCVYKIKNNGQARKCLLGYPVQYGFSHPSSSWKDFSWPLDPELDDIRMSIDGETVDYKKYIHGMNPDLKAIDYDEVYGFESYFKSGDEKTINISHTMVLYSTIIEANTHLDQYIGYILKSGQTYQTAIGNASIDVRFHFPATLEILESPGEYKIGKNKETGATVAWRLKDFKPMKDISIRFKNNEETYSDSYVSGLLEKINSDKTFSSFLDFTRALGIKRFAITNKQTQGERSKYLSVVGDNKNNIVSISVVLSEEEQLGIRALFKRYLIADDTSSDIAGFIISSIARDPKLDPGGEVVLFAKKKVDQNIITAYKRDLRKINAVIDAVQKNRNDYDLLHHATMLLVADRTSENFLRYSKEGDEINNYYYAGINRLHASNEYQLTFKKLRQSLEDIFLSSLDTLLEDKKENVDSIADLVQKMMPAFGLGDRFLNMVYELRTDVERKGEKTLQVRKLHKLLEILLCVKTDNSHFLEETRTIIEKSRDLVRKAYYAIANYYFVTRDFGKAVFFYRVAFSYCVFSPLWDYFGGRMFGAQWSDWNDENLKAIGVKSPWWKDIPDPYGLTENDIVNLYTPKRLLSLNLGKWESEGEANAPAYYLAYNTACAYSRLEKADEAIQWLEVALKLKPDIKKLIPVDSDLTFIRDGHEKALDSIMK